MVATDEVGRISGGIPAWVSLKTPCSCEPGPRASLTPLPPLAQDAAGPDPAPADRCAALEAELRKSKRREEKLQALQYRLREDVKACGGDLDRLEDLRERRSLEYELDRTQNQASREKAALSEQLRAALAKCAALEGGKGAAPRRGVLQTKENVYPARRSSQGSDASLT